MADGWERKYNCVFRGSAVLPGFSRAFDKASIQSRGSRNNPAPTLRVVASEDECHGVAFEFKETVREAILQELLAREGKTFPLRERPVRLNDGRTVNALVPIYEGKQILAGRSLHDLAHMAIRAHGEKGNGVAYVRDIARHLSAAGIHDAVVSDLLAAIDALLKIDVCIIPPKADRSSGDKS